MRTPSQKELKQRKFLVVLPVLVLPFVIMIFWALGGGSKVTAQTTVQQTKGLDLQLPDPQKQDDKSTDKLSFYQEAEKDSAKLQDQWRNDPYNRDSVMGNHLYPDTIDTGRLHSYGISNVGTNPNEEQINQKMADLYKQINDAQNTSVSNAPDAQTANQMQQINNMMKNIGGNSQPDPEMQQLSGMLDKILYIEHPEMAKEQMRQQSLKNKKQVFIVTAVPNEGQIQLMHGPSTEVQKPRKNKQGNNDVPEANGFYDWSNTAAVGDDSGNAVQAEVADTRTVVTGATVKLRLLNDIFIHGRLIPKDQYIFGSCSVSGDRLLVSLTSIRYHSSIYPVAMAVFDMDGMAGINIPDAINRQVAKSSSDQAVNGIDLYAFDNSVSGQAASAGVQAAKSLFSKKVELVKVTIKEGYKVFLKNTDEQ